MGLLELLDEQAAKETRLITHRDINSFISLKAYEAEGSDFVIFMFSECERSIAGHAGQSVDVIVLMDTVYARTLSAAMSEDYLPESLTIPVGNVIAGEQDMGSGFIELLPAHEDDSLGIAVHVDESEASFLLYEEHPFIMKQIGKEIDEVVEFVTTFTINLNHGVSEFDVLFNGNEDAVDEDD